MFWPFTVWGFPKPIFKPHEYWICKACCCNSTYRLRYWNFLITTSPETVRPLVAIVLTVYGIETEFTHAMRCLLLGGCNSTYRLRYWNLFASLIYVITIHWVAIVLTVYGIETITFDSHLHSFLRCNSTYRLRYWNSSKYTGCRS